MPITLKGVKTMTFNILQQFRNRRKARQLAAPTSVTPKLQAAIDHGVAERSAISAAVCAGMADGSFYRDPKGTVAGARAKYKR